MLAYAAFTVVRGLIDTLDTLVGVGVGVVGRAALMVGTALALTFMRGCLAC